MRDVALGPRASKSKLRSRFLFVSAICVFLAGSYLLVLVLSPSIVIRLPQYSYDQAAIPKADKAKKGNRIIIPKIGVDIEYRSGGPEVLSDYAWHRYPERGDPEKGGNMIISAHRFSLAPTPTETRRKSPFYNIHKLKSGDVVTIYHESSLYRYVVKERKRVSPFSIEIESPTDKPVLTIYSCTLGGENDGREVVVAYRT